MDIEARLREAIAAGEVLKIIYQGGSQPGAAREIAPMGIHGNKVMARCFTSNAIKEFNLEKIKILDGDTETQTETWRVGASAVERYNSLETFLEESKSLLVDLGWHVEHTDASVSLHRRKKNGTPLKGYDVWILYEEYAYDSVLGLDGQVHKENLRKRQRPWTVRGRDQETKSFGALDKAVELFMGWAKSLSPNNVR